MVRQRCYALAVLTLALFSCTAAPLARQGPYTPVYISNRARYDLLPPGDIDVHLDMVQHIRGSYGKTEFLLDAWVQADENAVIMAFFNSFGVSMGDLSFDERGISFSSAVLPSSIKGEYLVADFQFCFFREDALALALKRAGLVFRVEKSEKGNIRSILEGSTVLITIEKEAAVVRYTNHLRGYSYTLEGDF